MDKQKLIRYKWAVYSILGLLALSLAIIGIALLETNTTFQSLVLNLSTELAGAVFIFIIVEQLFLLTNDKDLEQLSAQIQQLKNDIYFNFNPLTNRENAQARFDFRDLVMDATSIDLSGYTCKTIFADSSNRSQLRQAIKKGTKVRVIVVDHKSLAGDLMRNHASHPDLVDIDPRLSLDRAIELKQEIDASKTKGSIEIRLTSWIPSCAITLIRTKGTGYAKIDLHQPSYKTSLQGRRSLILSSIAHAEDFKFYGDQFDFIWQRDSYQLKIE